MLRSLLGLLLPFLLTAAGQAKLEWDSTVFDYAAKVTDEAVSAAFHFKVVGEQPVTLSSIRSSCGCTTAKLEKRTYQPGESGVIEAHFDFGSRIGAQEKYISVQTDDPSDAEHNLLIKVYIPHVLKVEPRFVYWTKGAETYPEQSIDLVTDTDLEVTITSVEADTEQLKLRWEPVGERRFRVWLQPEIPEGSEPFFRAILKVTIDAPVSLKQRVFHAYAFMKSS